jgi:uncharacterized protein with GYD domain
MPTFIVQGKFSQPAIKGMLQTPEDRSESVSRLMERLGGSLLQYYMTTGEYDWMVISEAPDAETAVAACIAAAGGGGVTDLKTILAWSGADAKAIFEKAGGAARSFKSAGQPAS